MVFFPNCLLWFPLQGGVRAGFNSAQGLLQECSWDLWCLGCITCCAVSLVTLTYLGESLNEWVTLGILSLYLV